MAKLQNLPMLSHCHVQNHLWQWYEGDASSWYSMTAACLCGYKWKCQISYIALKNKNNVHKLKQEAAHQYWLPRYIISSLPFLDFGTRQRDFTPAPTVSDHYLEGAPSRG
ncbi:unnamed protein product [Owenia fusiformis]|uniref:Uncharacterized protein n=1 Tax=Owenia fusiformis TaxID=6347 RepID=A0A8J1UQN2_OWEFU|nr:unnamed protein product [Owenia fusiformis]